MYYPGCLQDAYLAGVAELTAVVAERDTAVLHETSRRETLEVLFRALRPALSELGAARLRRQLNGQDKMALRVADQVDNGHVWRNVLLLGDQIHAEAIVSQSLLDGGQAEDVGGSTRVGTQTDAEDVEVLLVRSVDEGLPSVFGGQLGNTSPVDDTATLAVESDVSLLVAQLALLGVGGALASRVALDTTRVAGAAEGTLDALVGAVRLVVADLSAVEALAGEAAALRLVGTFAGEVAGLVAAAVKVSGKCYEGIQATGLMMTMHVQCIVAVRLGVYLHAARLIATITSTTAAGIVTAATPRVASTGSVGVSASVPLLAATCMRVSLIHSAQARRRYSPLAPVSQDITACDRV
jgi:hypothetical protein